MRQRRRLAFPLLTACAVATLSACGPNEQAQTVSFVLSIDSERVSRIEFVVGYSFGKFAGTDGQCVVSSAAGPRSVATSEARVLEQDRVRFMSRPEKRARAAEVRATAERDTTATTVPTTTLAEPAAAPRAAAVCGNGIKENGEECDDGNSRASDGCDACNAIFAFSSVDDDQGELTIEVTNGLGIPPGAALAFCKFQGDIADADLVIQTRNCDRPDGEPCIPATEGIVTVSTTTTTTTTTTSTVSTTSTTSPTGTSSTTTTDQFP